MSRSGWASTEGCALVRAAARGAGRLGTLAKPEDDGCLGRERLLATAPSLTRLRWLVAFAALVFAFGPAVSLAAAVRGKQHNSQSTVIGVAHARARARGTARARAHGASAANTDGSASAVGAGGGGLLALGSGYDSPGGASAVRWLQRRLAGLGFWPGPVDGRYGAVTEAAVIGFQADNGLRADGIAGPRTRAALSAGRVVLYPGAGYVPGGSPVVRSLQRRLAAAGFAPGPIDGRYGPVTERAVVRFQAANGLNVDGIAGPRTLARLAHHGKQPRRVHRRARPVRSRPRATHRSHAPAAAPRRRDGATRAAGLSWLALVLVGGLVVGSLAGVLVTVGRRRRGRVLRALLAARDRRPVPYAADRAGARMYGIDRERVSGGEWPDGVAACAHADPRGELDEAFRLGLLLEERGKLLAAEVVYQYADQRGDANAAYRLGGLLQGRGELAEAEAAYRRADQRGHAGAACSLGELLEDRGDLAGAQSAFYRADQRGDATGAFDLALLLERSGDLVGAAAAYQRAEVRGVAAACNLGLLLEHQGDLSGAESAFRRADQSGDPIGTYNLGRMLQQRGRLGETRDAFQRAGQSGFTEIAQLAHAALAELDTTSDRRGADQTHGEHDDY